MTDLQLAILLRQYHARLVLALARIEEQLPDSLAVEHQVKNFLMPNGINTYTEYPILAELREIVGGLEQSAEKLEQGDSAQ